MEDQNSCIVCSCIFADSISLFCTSFKDCCIETSLGDEWILNKNKKKVLKTGLVNIQDLNADKKTCIFIVS